MKKLSGIKKIGVLQAKSLGDFIDTLPALTALKETYPEAELVFLGKPWHRVFLQGRRNIPVDRVAEVPIITGIRNEKGRQSSEKEITQFLVKMKKEKFDVLMHFQGDGKKVNPFLKQMKAGTTVGMRINKSKLLDYSVPYVHYQKEVFRFLEIVGLVGAKTQQLEPFLPVEDKDLKEARRVFSKVNGEYIVFHPGAADIRRRWPKEKFVKLGRLLIKKGFAIVLTGAGREIALVREITKGLGRKQLTQAEN